MNDRERATGPFVPFGPEWEKGVMKVPKKFIVDMLRKALKPKASSAVVSSELVRQISEALQPFASEFKRQMAKSGANSTARREWNDRMPDGFPITLKVTMGDCRRAVAALPNDESSDGRQHDCDSRDARTAIR